MYAGETVEITSAITDFDGVTVVDNTVVASCSVEIVDSANNVVQATTNMVHSAPRSLWYFNWNTTSLEVGTYRAKVVATGVDPTQVNINYLTIRLKAQPF